MVLDIRTLGENDVAILVLANVVVGRSLCEVVKHQNLLVQVVWNSREAFEGFHLADGGVFTLGNDLGYDGFLLTRILRRLIVNWNWAI